MKKQQILFWIIFLIAIDQAVKIIINVYFLDIKFEIIPGFGVTNFAGTKS